MTEAYEWGAFYRALGRTAPHYLEGADPSLLEYVAYEAGATDNYWSAGLQATLDTRWDAAPADAVRHALDQRR